MNDIRLLPIPLFKFIKIIEVFRITDTPTFACTNRMIYKVNTCKILRQKVRIPPKLNSIIKIFDKLVVQFIMGYEVRHNDHHTC